MRRAIVITGSRSYSMPDAVQRVLRGLHGGTLVIHGDCPTGADRYAALWLRSGCRDDLREVAMPAQWDRHGKSAGPLRNSAMVRLAGALRDTGWDVEVHAFPVGKSVGTRHCMLMFTNAKFKVINHGDP